jgi:hypothetical protein
MSNLKNDLIRLGNSNPDLRKHIRPVLDKIGLDMKEPWREKFDQAANQLNVAGLDADTQNTVVNGFAALNQGSNPRKAKKKFMKARQNVSGRAGSTLDQMIAALEEAGRTASTSNSRVASGKQVSMGFGVIYEESWEGVESEDDLLSRAEKGAKKLTRLTGGSLSSPFYEETGLGYRPTVWFDMKVPVPKFLQNYSKLADTLRSGPMGTAGDGAVVSLGNGVEAAGFSMELPQGHFYLDGSSM